MHYQFLNQEMRDWPKQAYDEVHYLSSSRVERLNLSH